jgi:hypothetical protein
MWKHANHMMKMRTTLKENLQARIAWGLAWRDAVA